MESLAQNKSTVTETNVSAILGKSHDQSQHDITRMMVREWYGLTPEPSNVVKGCDQEHLTVIKAAFEKETGMTITNGGHYQHPDNNFFNVWIAGFLADDIIEIQCPASIQGNTKVNAREYLESYPMKGKLQQRYRMHHRILE